MPIKVRKCFEIITEESAREGDAESRGIAWEGEMTAREVSREIRGAEPSQYPCYADEMTARTWATIDCGQDFRTGSYRSESLHLADSRPSALRAWRAAFKAAGLAS